VGAIACRCQRQHPAFAWGWVRALLHSLDAARTNILALTTFPKAAWRPICSTTPKERLNREIRRRTDVVGIPPDRTAQVRLVGDVLAEQHDEWTEQHRYLSLDIVAKSRLIKITNETSADQEVMSRYRTGWRNPTRATLTEQVPERSFVNLGCPGSFYPRVRRSSRPART
jgi:hypothetical protein